MEVEQVQNMLTPSSEEADPENVQISSDSGDYEIPPVLSQKPRLRKHTTVSSVTADTRKILEQFLKRSALCGSSNFNSFLEHQYAVVGDLLDEDPQPTPYQQIGSDDECFSDFFQSFSKGDASRFNTEPDYVDCQMLVKELINAEAHRKNLHHRSHKKINSPPGNVKFAVGGGAKPKKKAKVKLEEEKEDDGSSSSTEDYEFPDTELLNRKKKSSFRLALERVRQSFRRQGKKTSDVSQDSSGGKVAGALSGEQRKEYPGKSEVPLPPTPVTWRPHSKLHRESSETSKTQATASGTPSEIDFGHGGKPSAAPDSHVLQVPHGTLSLDEKKKKSPALWRKFDVREKGNEEKVRENRGIFEIILRQFRKGSSKLKRKGGSHVVKQRFHSADNLAVHPPKEDEKKLVEHFARLNSQDIEYDSDFATAHSRIDRAAFSQLERRPFSGLASRQGHHSFRHKMQLDGLVACRPHMPVPSAFEGGDDLQKLLLAVPVSSSESGSIGAIVDRDPVEDSVDFGLAEIERVLSCSTSKPFSQKSEREKDELFEKIAEQLAIIADHYNLDSPSSPPLLNAASHNKESEEKKPDKSEHAEAKNEESVTLDSLVPHQLSQLNCVHNASGFSNSPAVAQLVKTPTYGTFKQIVSDNVGAEAGWQQIAKLFRLTQSAIHLAGMGTSVAGVINDMTIRYFEDRFASWIVGQGGWESMVEDTNTELDSELD